MALQTHMNHNARLHEYRAGIAPVHIHPAVYTRNLKLQNACRRSRAGLCSLAQQMNRQSHVLVRASGAEAAVPVQGGTSAACEVYDAVVVGAGISGLVIGQALHSKHHMKNFLVTEARDVTGGNITTREGDGYLWEEGPNSFQPTDAMLQISVDAGVDKDIVLADPKAPRFVLWGGKLRKVPSGPDVFTFDLMSIMGKLRAGLGALGILKAPMPAYEESVEEFVKRNLGDEVFYRLIEPFCSGVYAGDPAKLSMKAAFPKVWELEKTGGSLVQGAFKMAKERRRNPPPPRNPALPPKPKGQTVGSFRKGIRTLTDAITKNIQSAVRTQWRLTGLSKDAAAGLFTLSYDTPQGPTQVVARTVVLTIPAYAAAEVLKGVSARACDALSSIDYPPVAAVTLSYPISAVREDRKDAKGRVPGFGQLHPRTQGITTLGTLYTASLFPARAPPGRVLLLNFLGGALDRGAGGMSQEALVKQADSDLRKMLLKPGAPAPNVIGVKVWPRAIPQFNLGHLETVEAAQQALRDAGLDGLMLGGNYVAGVALGRCVEQGYEYADIIARRTNA